MYPKRQLSFEPSVNTVWTSSVAHLTLRVNMDEEVRFKPRISWMWDSVLSYKSVITGGRPYQPANWRLWFWFHWWLNDEYNYVEVMVINYFLKYISRSVFFVYAWNVLQDGDTVHNLYSLMQMFCSLSHHWHHMVHTLQSSFCTSYAKRVLRRWHEISGPDLFLPNRIPL